MAWNHAFSLFTIAAASVFPLTLGAQESEEKPDLDRLLEKRVFTQDGAKLPYRLLKPDGYNTAGAERYPLVVFLHGMGERGTDNEKQLRHGVAEFAKPSMRKKHPCFLIAPQCPPDRMWVDLARGDTRRNVPLSAKPTEPTALVLELIEALGREFRIDTDRIYVTGLSMGGYGTWDVICRRPDLFAAAIPICGGGDPAQAEKLVGLPIWVFHGSADRAVPPERSRDMIEAIKKAGGKPKYTEYEGVGHNSWTRTYENTKVLDWLFSQKKSKATR